ncbi:hypothetical protein MJK71_08350 [Escherichia coli]|nr:hypothetical protein MJK71_08350 [Escherichia coli]
MIERIEVLRGPAAARLWQRRGGRRGLTSLPKSSGDEWHGSRDTIFQCART